MELAKSETRKVDLAAKNRLNVAFRIKDWQCQMVVWLIASLHTSYMIRICTFGIIWLEPLNPFGGFPKVWDFP